MSTEAQRLISTADALLNAAERAARGPNIPDTGIDLYSGGGAPGIGGLGPGDLFVRSDAYKAIADPASRPQQWSTGIVDVSVHSKAGTLLESDQGGGWTTTPQVVPGVVDTLFEPADVVAAFSSTQVTTSSARYIVEGTAVSGAAGVAEGAEKPPSDLAYSTVDEPIRKLATFLAVSDEMLEDAPALRRYLNGRLSLFVRLEEGRQLLRGAGGGSNELVGLFSRGINTYSRGASDDNAVALAKALANTAGSANVAPSHIVMHPSNWLSTRLLRDGTGGTTGSYLGGGPFNGFYSGGAVAPGLFGQNLWGVPVILSTVVGSGTALLGDFRQSAQIYRRGGVTVEASNSHDSFFQTNMVALRAESRLGLACYRPSAFTAVSGLT